MSPLADYSSLEKEIADAPDPVTLKKGTEVKARIITVRTGISDKNNAAWFSVVFDVPSEVLAKEFSDFFWDLADHSKLEPKQAAANLRRFRDFAASFGIDYRRPFSWEDDLPGKEGWLIVGIRKSDEYGEQNTVQKYLSGTSRVTAQSAPADDGAPF